MRKILFLFGQLNDDDVNWIIRNGRKQVLERGQLLVQEGHMDEQIYIVMSGSFTVFREKSGRRLASLASGEVVGEISMVDRRPPSASVKAEETSACLCLPKEALRRVLKTDTGFGARFYRSVAMFLAERLRNSIRDAGEDGTQSGFESETELDDEVLENVHLASVRFNHMLTSLGS